MWNIVIRDRKGFEHFLKYDMNTTVATHVKREEITKEAVDLDLLPLDQDLEEEEKKADEVKESN
jgi:hypothetical protein